RELDGSAQKVRVGEETYLHEDAFDVDLPSFTGHPIFVAKLRDMARVADDFCRLRAHDDVHVGHAPDLPLQDGVCFEFGCELQQGDVFYYAREIDGRLDSGVSTTDDGDVLPFEQGTVTVRAVGHAAVSV